MRTSGYIFGDDGEGGGVKVGGESIHLTQGPGHATLSGSDAAWLIAGLIRNCVYSSCAIAGYGTVWL